MQQVHVEVLLSDVATPCRSASGSAPLTPFIEDDATPPATPEQAVASNGVQNHEQAAAPTTVATASTTSVVTVDHPANATPSVTYTVMAAPMVTSWTLADPWHAWTNPRTWGVTTPVVRTPVQLAPSNPALRHLRVADRYWFTVGDMRIPRTPPLDGDGN